MPKNKSSVLIVDDNKINRQVLSQYLEQLGLDITTAEDGLEALKKLSEQSYDLILLDIIMPKMDGYEVLKFLKQGDLYHHIPVIVISALDDIESLVKAIELGAEDYLAKPFNPVLLKARIESTLEKKRLRNLEQETLIKAKQKVEKALEETEIHLETIVSNSPIILFAVDPMGIIQIAQGMGLKTLNLEAENIIGKSANEIFENIPEISRYIKNAIEGKAQSSIVTINNVVLEIHFSFIKDSEGNLESLIGVASDITERKIAEEEKEKLHQEVINSHSRLRTLSRHLVDIQEKERRQIARELHDEVGQSLTGLKISLELGKRFTSEKGGVYLQEAQGLTNDLLSIVREMSLNLRPGQLDDLGLLPTVVWYIERFENQTNIDVQFKHNVADERYDPQIETTAYRIIQEALTNIARHANKSNVNVELTSNQKNLYINIKDNGPGFDLEKEIHSGKSSGILGIMERTDLVNGELKFNTAPGNGTEIQIKLPITDEGNQQND